MSDLRQDDEPGRSQRGPSAGAAAIAVAIAGIAGLCLLTMGLPTLVSVAALGAVLSLLTGSALWLVAALGVVTIGLLAYRYRLRSESRAISVRATSKGLDKRS